MENSAANTSTTSSNAEPKDSFNIFNILNSADREMVHSSMIRWLIKEAPEVMLPFFGIEPVKGPLTVKTEVASRHKDTDPKKAFRVRFDIVGYSAAQNENSDDNTSPIFIIENKFKAIPTLRQLEQYKTCIDDEKWQIKQKILLALSNSQIPHHLHNEAAKIGWSIRTYFGQDPKIALLPFLTQQVIEGRFTFDSKEEQVIRDYCSYLQNISTKIDDLIKLEAWVEFKSEDRFYYFQYLLAIQADICNKLTTEVSGISLSNDGGKNPIPSIAFWKNTQRLLDNGIRMVYGGIDGDVFKLGVLYRREKSDLVASTIAILKSDLSNTLCDPFKEFIIKDSFSIKKVDSNKESLVESNNGKESVKSIFLYSIPKKSKREKVVTDCANIIESYFKLLDEQTRN